MRAARNELLSCLDSDDLLVPGSVAGLAEDLLAKGANVSAFGELWHFKDEPPRVLNGRS